MTSIITRRPSIVLATGGPTLEAEGTTASTAALAAHFQSTGHTFAVVDVAQLEDLVAALRRVDLVFNAVHGRGGEDGGLHYLAELAGGVPVTGPAWWTHYLGADKIGFKAWASRHVRVPRNHDEPGPFPHGFVSKPRFGGGSIGLTATPVIDDDTLDAGTVVEEYIPGRIITCCIYPRLAERMPLLLIEPAGTGLYDEAAKRGRADIGYRVIPLASAAWAEQVDASSLQLYWLLGGRGPIRFDWIIEDGTDDPVLLEVNTNPGWRPAGNMGRIVTAAGRTYHDLVDTVIVEALDCNPTGDKDWSR
jgi:D-alanine-D-alanine ligase